MRRGLHVVLSTLLLFDLGGSTGRLFSLCTDRKEELLFSTDSCPGGVLLKSLRRIDRICQCEGTSLLIYDRCAFKSADEPVRNVTDVICDGPDAISKPPWMGQALLLIPVRTTGRDKCSLPHDNCGRANEKGKSSGFFQPSAPKKRRGILERSEKAEPDPSSTTEAFGSSVKSSSSSGSSNPLMYSARSLGPMTKLKATANVDEMKNAVEPSEDSMSRREDELNVMEGAEERVGLLRFVAGVKEGQIPDPQPVSKTFRMLKESMKIVTRKIPSRLIKELNLYEAYLGFSYIFRHIDEDMQTDRHLSLQDYQSIMLSLDFCREQAVEFAFKTGGRPRQIKFTYLRNGTRFSEVDPTIPGDRAHKSNSEDVIIGIMWKVIDIIHSACFEDFRRNSPSTQFDYIISLEDVFLRSEVQARWYRKPEAAESSIISHPNVDILMNNLDKIDATAHLNSRCKAFLRKPKVTSVSTEPLNEREKRENGRLFKSYEIWEGQAYCLQLQRPTELPSLDNTQPPLNLLCHA